MVLCVASMDLIQSDEINESNIAVDKNINVQV